MVLNTIGGWRKWTKTKSQFFPFNVESISEGLGVDKSKQKVIKFVSKYVTLAENHTKRIYSI